MRSLFKHVFVRNSSLPTQPCTRVWDVPKSAGQMRVSLDSPVVGSGKGLAQRGVSAKPCILSSTSGRCFHGFAPSRRSYSQNHHLFIRSQQPLRSVNPSPNLNILFTLFPNHCFINRTPPTRCLAHVWARQDFLRLASP